MMFNPFSVYEKLALRRTSLPIADDEMLVYLKGAFWHFDRHMSRAIGMGWFVLSNYYRLTDEVLVYAAILFLDPRKRIAYMKQNWPKEWHDGTIAQATAFWREEFNYD